MNRRQALHLAAAGALAAASMGALAADPFPTPGKPITLVLPSVSGSAGDQVLRMLGDKLKDEWKVPVVVESKPGANGAIGAQFVAKAPPDGHTMLLGFSALVQAPAFGVKTPYDPMADFVPVARLNDVPLVLLTGDPSITSMSDFVARAKQNPEQYNFGSYGPATTGHVYSSLINQKNGLNLVHVPFKGTPPLTNALLGGHVKTGVSNLDSLPHVKAGKLRVLAITGTKRSALLPEVPTFQELGYDITAGGRYWLLLPAGVATDTVEKIREAVLRVLRMPDIQQKMLAIGLEPTSGQREDVAGDMRKEIDYWKRVVQATGIKPAE
ncbi:tripartite tricarboxylate transporter substrate binding protein [Ramlibacter henchirensis]|uniref:Tripartite tricarboxylate transporter substrate binding protein n=1 Tax=Ramlibacter henchirensis TaxID=204072 RepID=A0A4Z0BXS5_9BURK|nr:tripartite tricarboxylate transporter substrate binding protein [Ramlibacter henchirensis]TFZ02729.1 tripartite tricarboxylate transporter substrate binding protein [Ramlibacter henchirensis]